MVTRIHQDVQVDNILSKWRTPNQLSFFLYTFLVWIRYYAYAYCLRGCFKFAMFGTCMGSILHCWMEGLVLLRYGGLAVRVKSNGLKHGN